MGLFCDHPLQGEPSLPWGKVNSKRQAPFYNALRECVGCVCPSRMQKTMERGYLLSKKPRVTFRTGPHAAELEAQMQRDPCLSLLGDIRRPEPSQPGWQIHEATDSKERGQLTTARAEGALDLCCRSRDSDRGVVYPLHSSGLHRAATTGIWTCGI